MRKPEQKLWDRMRNALKGKVYLERIENIVHPGRPDVDSMWDGIVLPIELKVVESYPKRSSSPVLGKNKGLNQNQLNWWLEWQSWGGFGFIVVGVGLYVFAVPAELSDEINGLTYSELLEHQVTWTQFIEIIRKEALCLRNR